MDLFVKTWYRTPIFVCIKIIWLKISTKFWCWSLSYKMVVNLKQSFFIKTIVMEFRVIHSVFYQEDLSNIVRFIVLTIFHSRYTVHPHCILRFYASPSHLVLCLMRGLGVPFTNKTSSTLYRGTNLEILQQCNICIWS